MRAFRDAKLLKTGDPVLVTSGVPIGHPGNTNLIQVVTTP
jgi:pyruvate kinase